MLLDDDSYGYQISKRIREVTGERYIMKETTLYSAFNRLEKNGFIESYAGDTSLGKPRTYLRITKEGRQHYHEKCVEWKVTQDVLNVFMKEVD
jgi:PadR family transcriptional regulator PadR